MTLIERVELTSAQASITFSNIPGTYTDLMVLYSLRTTGNSIDPSAFYFNTDNGTNYSMRMLYGNGSSTASASNANYLAEYNNWAIFWLQSTGTTANTFNSVQVYIPNYSLTNVYKSLSVDAVTENNATSANQQIGAGIWRSNSAINAITLTAYSSNFVQYSSASLYGILKGSDGTTTVA